MQLGAETLGLLFLILVGFAFCHMPPKVPYFSQSQRSGLTHTTGGESQMAGVKSGVYISLVPPQPLIVFRLK